MMHSLETRTLLSAVLENGLLTVTGTDGDDRIEIADSKTVIMSMTMPGTPHTTIIIPKVAVILNGVTQHFLLADVQRIIVHGLAGNDRIDAAMAPHGIHFDGGAGNDTIIGTAHPDTLIGGAGNDRLRARAGDDLLDGGQQNDLLSGGTGRDTADFSQRQDDLVITLDGIANDGGKTGLECGPDNTCFPALYDETDNVLPNIENLFGGAGDDRIVGSYRHNLIKGNAGDDTIRGLAGNDLLVGGAGADLIKAGGGHDDVFINDADADTASGGNGMDGILADNADTTTGFERATGLVEKWILD